MSFYVIDVESDGQILGRNSLVCFGAVRLDNELQTTFYGKTRPISEEYDGEALAVSGFSRSEHESFDDPKLVFERFGEWLKGRTGNAGDASFVNAFVTASLTVSIGAMAIIGSIQDGLLGDFSTLAVKSVLDFIIIAVMTSSMGKGAAFSALPVFVFEGAMTLLARLLSPVMTATAVAYLSLIGSVLIFCIGVNLVWGKKLSVANMLPSVLLAILAAYLPWGF